MNTHISAFMKLICASAFAASAAASEPSAPLPDLSGVEKIDGVWIVPSPPPVFMEARKSGPHNFYADNETFEFLGGLTEKMSEVARRDIFLATPGSFLKMKPSEWANHPFAKKWNGYKDPKSWEAKESDIKGHFQNLQQDLRSIINGENYFSYNTGLTEGGKGNGCLISGSMNISVAETARQHGLIPRSLVTADFKTAFDRKSFLTLILLHEAAHCTQDMHKTHERSAKYEKDDIEKLRFEIDADQRAHQAYYELINTGWNLDPDMPSKLTALRYLSFIFNNAGANRGRTLENDFYMDPVPYSHITAGVTHGGTSYKEAMKTMRSAMKYYIMSLLLIRESATAEIANEAKARSQKGFNASASNILNVISKGLAAKTRAGLEDPNIKATTTSVMEGAYMVRETPETIYMAAKMLSEYEFSGLKGETRAFIKNYSRGVIKAWEDLHLRTVDFETLNEFEKRVLREQDGRIELKALPAVIKGP